MGSPRGPVAFASLVALSAAGACRALPDLSVPSCGNAVIDTGEDCDGFGDPSTPASACIGPTQPGACHFACDPTRTPTGCPQGYACGATGICRAPGGAFAPQTAAFGSSPTGRVLAADFDGDHAADVVTVGATTEIHFFDGRAEAARTPMSSVSTPPSLGKLGSAANPRASAVVITHFEMGSALDGNLRVWRGSADRTLLPTVYPTIDLSGDGSKLTGGEMLPAFRVGELGSDIFALMNPDGTSSFELDYIVGSEDTSYHPPEKLFGGLASSDAVDGDIPIGVLGDGSCANAFTVCQNFVLAYQGATAVAIYPTCDGQGGLNVPGGSQTQPATMTLPGDTVAGPAFLIVDPVATPSASSLFVVGKQGLWEFPATPCGLASTPTLRPEVQTAAKILAAGFIDKLDGGKYVDWVDTAGIHVTYGYDPTAATYEWQTTAAPDSWTEARIDDFNHNGAADVAALSSTSFDFYNGLGSALLNGKHVSVDGTPEHLAVGDFDGDFVKDFAFDTKNDSTGLATDNVQMAFGTLSGFPTAPRSVGRLSSTHQLQSAFFDYRLTGSFDFVSSLFAISKEPSDGHIVASFLQGSPDRLINSPFFLAPTSQRSIASAAVGDFGARRDASNVPQLGVAGAAFGAVPGLWFAPADDDAQLDVTKSAVTAGDVGLSAAYLGAAGIAAIDVGGAPGDELAVLEPGDATTQACFFVAAVDPGKQQWTVPACERPEARALGPSPYVLLRAADVDGDGKQDLLASYADAGGAFVVRVLFNDESGSLSFAAGVTPALPLRTVAVAAIHFREAPSAQLIALSQDGLFVADLTGRTIGPFQNVVDFAADASASASIGIVDDLVVADVDGDGVDDAVVATTSGFRVYFGEPKD